MIYAAFAALSGRLLNLLVNRLVQSVPVCPLRFQQDRDSGVPRRGFDRFIRLWNSHEFHRLIGEVTDRASTKRGRAERPATFLSLGHELNVPEQLVLDSLEELAALGGREGRQTPFSGPAFFGFRVLSLRLSLSDRPL